MAPKEPTRHQLSSRLAYSQNTPAFLQKLKNRIAGTDDQYDEFEDDGSGRPPIPRRPAIPTRPDDDPGSADEDGGDEKPQVVVLREGKHLTAHEAEKIRRKGRMDNEKHTLHLPHQSSEKGLPLLPDLKTSIEDLPGAASDITASCDAKGNKMQMTSLTFSSFNGKTKNPPNKRKVPTDTEDGDDRSGAPSKKPKKPSKALLSFGDDA